MALQVVFYYSEKDPRAPEYVPLIDHLYIEHGLSNQVYRCMDSNREIATRSEIKLLDNVENFIDEYIGFSELVVGNFSTIFYFYFFICLAITLIFVTKILLSILKRKIAAIQRRICVRILLGRFLRIARIMARRVGRKLRTLARKQFQVDTL